MNEAGEIPQDQLSNHLSSAYSLINFWKNLCLSVSMRGKENSLLSDRSVGEQLVASYVNASLKGPDLGLKGAPPIKAEKVEEVCTSSNSDGIFDG